LPRTPVGSKIRERRKALGLTQAALAHRLGISASYLNLIEADRRNIAGALLSRTAEALGVAVDQFDGAAERRLVEDLCDIALDPLLWPLAPAAASATELASQHPHWARALVGLHRAYRDRSEAVAALSDRLQRDPLLGDAVHSMLTHVTAIRSAAEILESGADLDAAQRQRFVAIVAGDSRRLSTVTQSLLDFFARPQALAEPVSPVEEVDDFLVERDNHFPRLELAADGLRASIGLGLGRDDAALADHLQRLDGVATEISPATSMRPAGAGTTRRFALARRAAERGARDAIADEVAQAASLVSSASRRRAEQALAGYVAAAMLMPYAEFHAAAESQRYDIDLLGQRFGTSWEQVCHRLVTLRRPGAEGVPFGFMRADPAGHVAKRFALPRLPLPRWGAACPLWAVYEAFRTPGGTVRQLADFPGGHRCLMLARAIEKERAGFGTPRRFMSVMLMCETLHADRLVYADGLDLSAAAPATAVGPACRVCVRSGCASRQEEAILMQSAPA
jgi:predicted transcriptional regulator/transcriptional regulator with XRE-family HTH domain